MPVRRDQDEGPSDEDIDRFGDDSPTLDARCPDCGARVWSEADVCPKCFSYLGGDAAPARRGPFADRWRTVVVVALVVALLTLAGVPVIQAFMR